ncbi:MAG: diguanylate cyclase [Coleofasciculaceae cyanobacterium SM2_3_26]|nr:diguanylate cyclase [Coleofasciculaceae cyanobacterium SM2_3_26]
MQPLPTPEQVHLATQWVIALEDHLRRSQMDTADRTNDRTNNPASPKQAPRIPCLLVVADTPILGEQLAAESSAWGIQIQFALNCRDAKRAIARDRLDVTVIDLHPSTHDTSETSPGLSLLADLSQPGSMPPMPILITCCNPSDRATAFRLGARMALPRFLSASQLLAFAWNTLHQEDRWHRNPTDRTAARPQLFPTQNRRPLILMLGSDRAGLTSLGDRLQGWGVQVQITTTPLAFWQALNLSLPDLVMVADTTNLAADGSAAGLDSFTLCRTLRQKGHASGIDLPILWIARNHDAIAVQQAFDAGATECICQPLVFEELVVRMFACLERIHLRWELAATNPLTHLPTPYTSSRDLSWFIRLSDRHRQPLCLALVAIDRLRHIGERFGKQFSGSFSEQIDDPWECAAILRHMANLLQQAFRSEDVIGHWCNETFAIGLYGSTKADGMQRVARFLEVFSSSGANEVFDTPVGDSLQLTCSAGIAQYPEDGNHLQALHQAAAAALNRARMLGCDRVLPAE